LTSVVDLDGDVDFDAIVDLDVDLMLVCMGKTRSS
jgi:hypothetical protein